MSGLARSEPRKEPLEHHSEAYRRPSQAPPCVCRSFVPPLVPSYTGAPVVPAVPASSRRKQSPIYSILPTWLELPSNNNAEACIAAAQACKIRSELINRNAAARILSEPKEPIPLLSGWSAALQSFLNAERQLIYTIGLMATPSSTIPESNWTRHESNIALHQCLSSRNPPIPNEIILQILDHPTQWIPDKSLSADMTSGNEPIRVDSNYGHIGEHQILATKPISQQEIAKIRRVVYTFCSQDQGWSSDNSNLHGTFSGSWTWFESGLAHRKTISREAEDSTRYELQRNRHAGRQAESYRHELDVDHELLQRVEASDSFTLWARARYPGWENRVYNASIEVWCLDDLAGTTDNS